MVFLQTKFVVSVFFFFLMFSYGGVKMVQMLAGREILCLQFTRCLSMRYVFAKMHYIYKIKGRFGRCFTHTDTLLDALTHLEWLNLHLLCASSL